MKAPLFSTYRQGENRVTSSILAVFQRVDLTIVERLLSAASGDPELLKMVKMVQFKNQPAGKGKEKDKEKDKKGVPDGEIAASFRYLFEVKTERDAVTKADDSLQLQRHLERLNRPDADERLFVVTPDIERPALVEALGDPRVIWFNFDSLAQAIDEALADTDDPLSEREAFLLRELRRLFDEEGILRPAKDIVVVAARFGYPTYLRYSAYICQLDRSFRSGIERMGFYTEKAIQLEFPRIKRRFKQLWIDEAEAANRSATDDPADAAAAHLIRRLLADKTRWANTEKQVFLLSPVESSETLRLPQPITHPGPGAWTQGQRYLRSADLERNPKSTVELSNH